MKVCTLYIQETVARKYIPYTINQNHIWKFFYTHTQKKWKLIMALVISTGKDKQATGKRQIRLSSNVSRANNKWSEQPERFYTGKN